MAKSFFNFWGKARQAVGNTDSYDWHPLAYHSLDVAAVAWVWFEKEPDLLSTVKKGLGFSDLHEFKSLISFFLGLHDLGKFADSFQGLNPIVRQLLGKTGVPPVYNVRHDSLGFVLWQNCFLYKRGKAWRADYGGLIVEDAWFSAAEVQNKIAWAEILNLLIQATTGHHGRPPILPEAIGVNSHFSEGDIAAATEFATDLFSLFKPSLPREQNWEAVSTSFKPLTFWLAGFSVVCDWLGSNAEIFRYRKEADLSLKEYFEHVAVENASSALRKSGLLSSRVMPYQGASKLFSYLQSPTPLQILCSEIPLTEVQGPALHILEDATGAGKTEAAMILAQRQMDLLGLRGFFIGLPTMATANGMYNRMYEHYRHLYDENEKPSLVLAHGARNLHDGFQESILDSKKNDANYRDEESASALCVAWIADNAKKSLLGDAGIGTIDQSLLAVLRSKFHTLRLFGLMHKVLILDEVHAYDAYMNELLCELIAAEARAGAPVIMLSATLPFALRGKFCQSYADGLGCKVALREKEKYPLLTQVSTAGVLEKQIETREVVRRTVRVEFVHDEQEILSLIENAVERHQCVCWLRNTVADAIAAYRVLKSHLGENILLFHARFVMGDRLDIENRVLNLFGAKSRADDRKAKVLIATQVVEQSLDLDFDVMITDLAPIDLMIQRAGRLHRHRRDALGNPLGGQGVQDCREAPCLWIHAPEFSEDPARDWYKQKFPKASFVYRDHAKLWLTAKWLAERKCWRMPDNAREMIEFVYGNEQTIPDSLQDWKDAEERKDNQKESLAIQNTINFSLGYTANNDTDWDDLSAPSRNSEQKTVKVVLAILRDGECIPWYTDSWSASEVSLPSYIAAAEDTSNAVNTAALARLKDTLHSRGKYAIFIVLSRDDMGYYGFVVNDKGQRVKLVYKPETGLEIGDT